jgi:hypothetical protein
MTDTPPPVTAEPAAPPPAAPPPGAAPRPATRSDKLRLVLILGGIGAFLAFVLWSTRDNQAADDLTAGTCFDVPAEETNISTVTRRDCTAAHDAEVFLVTENTTATSYPISLSLDSFIDEACVPVFATYVGETFDESEDYTIGYFYPNREAWDSGDRTFTCYVVRVDEAKMTQPVNSAGS